MSRVRLRPEVAVIAVLAAVLSFEWSVQWLLAVVIHELGHGVLGALLTRRPARFDLQLGAADAYVGPEESLAVRRTVTAGGLGLSLAYAIGRTALGLEASAAWAWLAYQAFPLPATDGGVALRDAMVRVGLGPAAAFSRTYAVGGALALLLLVVLWTAGAMTAFGLALVLAALGVVIAETERPALTHLEAHRAWSEGRHDDVLAWAERLGRSSLRLKRHVYDLGLRSATELGDADAVQRFGEGLPASNPSRLEAAELLLDLAREAGARWAEEAVADYDRAPSAWSEAQRDQLRQLLIRFSRYETRAERPRSASSLLARARALGPVDLEWLRYENAAEEEETKPQ